MLLSLFTLIYMVGCGSPDLDDNVTRDKVIAEAIDANSLKEKMDEGPINENIRPLSYYAGNEVTPYTRWAKKMYDNGQIFSLEKYKDGKPMILTTWHMNGQKKKEQNYKLGWRDGLRTTWDSAGYKDSEGNYTDGTHAGTITYNEDGTKSGSYRQKGRWD
jgi:antitoxin component YwqK of YwqJK toxin-antitoxin module